eukprot:c23412_g1_i1 orf=717-1439(-)
MAAAEAAPPVVVVLPPHHHQEVVAHAEQLVQTIMGQWDSSHDAFHAFRVRDVALSLAAEEGLPPDRLEIVELAALLHDIDDHKYAKSGKRKEDETAHGFLTSQGVAKEKIEDVMSIIKNMGFKEELDGTLDHQGRLEFGIVQDADRLDAIGAIGIARCFTFGGSRNQVLYDPQILPRINMTKEEYMKHDGKQTTLNHFHEKLLKLKDLMKTKAGHKRAVIRDKFMEDFLAEFHKEWEGKA